jgi:hypothetical protein
VTPVQIFDGLLLYAARAVAHAQPVAKSGGGEQRGASFRGIDP